jgi:hypothetical protein
LAGANAVAQSKMSGASICVFLMSSLPQNASLNRRV